MQEQVQSNTTIQLIEEYIKKYPNHKEEILALKDYDYQTAEEILKLIEENFNEENNSIRKELELTFKNIEDYSDLEKQLNNLWLKLKKEYLEEISDEVFVLYWKKWEQIWWIWQTDFTDNWFLISSDHIWIKVYDKFRKQWYANLLWEIYQNLINLWYANEFPEIEYSQTSSRAYFLLKKGYKPNKIYIGYWEFKEISKEEKKELEKIITENKNKDMMLERIIEFKK